MPTTINNSPLGNGVNLQPSYYNGGKVNFGWELMQQYPNIKTVRIEIEPNMADEAAGWIAAAKANNYQVIATYHKCAVLGTDDVNELLAAANWWKENYPNLGTGFIINLMNEWGSHNISATDYAAAYNQAIAIIRNVYTGDIIIDLPGWGQDANTAANAASLITDQNIVFSAHIYKDSWNSGTGNFFAPSNIDTLIASGTRCIVGEFGPVGTKTCDWSACVDYVLQRNLTIIGWCWNGDGNGNNMVSPAWSDEPTATTFEINTDYFNAIYGKMEVS